MLLCWCLAVPQSKPSPPTIAQPCTSKSDTPPNLTLSLFLPQPQTGNSSLLASSLPLADLGCWATQSPQGGLDLCLPLSQHGQEDLKRPPVLYPCPSVLTSSECFPHSSVLLTLSPVLSYLQPPLCPGSLCPALLTGFQHSWYVWGATGHRPAP